jgi:hypothetical protein
MSIRNANLLYRPSISLWEARKKDKAKSIEVNEGAGAVVGAANVNKQLLPDSKELLAIQKWRNGFRQYIYDNTATWLDDGWRIAGVARHMDFMSEVGDRIRTGEGLVDEFMACYAQEIEHAKFTLNTMFNPADYPGVQEVRAKFRFTVDVMPMPTSEDFRIVDGIPQGEVDKLVAIATTETEKRIADAMKESYGRLYTVVTKMANTLEQYGDKTIKKFNDSLVDNIAELVDVMPSLNLTDDPHLKALTAEAKQLAAYSAADLRQVDGVREAAIEDARILAAKFQGLVSAPTTVSIIVAEEIARNKVADALANQRSAEALAIAAAQPVDSMDMSSIFADMMDDD